MTEERWQVFDNIKEADKVELSSGDLVVLERNRIDHKCMVIKTGSYKYMLVCMVTGNRFTDTVVETYKSITLSMFILGQKLFMMDDEKDCNHTYDEYDKIKILLRGM